MPPPRLLAALSLSVEAKAGEAPALLDLPKAPGPSSRDRPRPDEGMLLVFEEEEDAETNPVVEGVSITAIGPSPASVERELLIALFLLLAK